MKIMIRNLLSVFQKLKYINCILILLTISSISIGQTQSDSEHFDLNIYSRENKLISFSKDSIYIIVVKNNKSCINCFHVVNEYLKLIDPNRVYRKIAVSYSDSNALSRKRNNHELMEIFPEFEGHAVIYSDYWKETKPTPELFIIRGNEQYRFLYNETFADGFELISRDVQNKIENILK